MYFPLKCFFSSKLKTLFVYDFYVDLCEKNPDSNPSKDAKVDGNTTTLLSYQRSLMTLNMIKRDAGDSTDWGLDTFSQTTNNRSMNKVQRRVPAKMFQR